jgi:methylenetetrahydrofolate dehydrogenase (NADP+) / methenyltetrahydrofolate cyclohydrolase
MKTKLINGKAIAKMIRQEIANEVDLFIQNGHAPPHLSAVIVGDDAASQVYVRNKGKACESVGMTHNTIQLSKNTSSAELITVIQSLNNDNRVSGILVQLPLPKKIVVSEILSAIDINKDVDGLSNHSLGALLKGELSFVPATPLGIRELLVRSDIAIPGKHVVVVGRSMLVGKPIAALLSLKSNIGDATVTLAHSATNNLKQITKSADILIVAAGIPYLIDGSMIKDGAVVIDVGINRVDDNSEKGYKLIGDVDLDSIMSIASLVTPVPGGVGPMTIAMIVSNTLQAAKVLQSG